MSNKFTYGEFTQKVTGTFCKFLEKNDLNPYDLTFTTLEFANKHLGNARFIAYIKLCEDAEFRIGTTNTIFMTSKFNVLKIESIWNNLTSTILAIQQDGLNLQYALNQTDEICMMAVNQNGMALQYVENQTDEICMMAVNQNGMALQYVENQTNEICIVAIRQNCKAFRYVSNKTETIWIEVVSKNGYLLEHIPSSEQTEEICKIAIQHSEGCAIRFVDIAEGGICEYNEKTGESITRHRCIKKELSMMAVQKNATSFKYVDYHLCDYALCEQAVRQNWKLLSYVPDKFRTKKICRLAIQQNGLALEYVKKQTPSLCDLAIRQNPQALKFVKDKTPHLCELASSICELLAQFAN